MTTPDAGAAERRTADDDSTARPTGVDAGTPPSPLPPEPGATRRGLALRYVVGAALGALSILAVRELGPRSPHSVYFVGNIAVVAGILIAGGFGPAAVTIVVAYAATSYFLLEPRGSLAIAEIADVVRFAIGLALSLLAAAIEGRLRRERQRMAQRE
ncbi:MAG TPA: DUF4118 domain-containing protein, partial [Gemmatimonadaceae bacterium]|nr:DUF4118 domain-containing protein [Gemmatimonadaceae bacterium]